MSTPRQIAVRLHYRGGTRVLFPCRNESIATDILKGISDAIEQECPTVRLDTILITTKHLHFAEVLEDVEEVPT